MRTFVIDGASFRSLREFAHVFSVTLLRDHEWNGHLDALNDILRGGFGTPDEGFVLRLINVAAAREALGHSETAIWLRERIAKCHASGRSDLSRRLADIEVGRGQTLFDDIIEIIRDHGSGGGEAEDNVVLLLETE